MAITITMWQWATNYPFSSGIKCTITNNLHITIITTIAGSLANDSHTKAPFMVNFC